MLKFFFGYKLTETDSPVYSHLLRWNNSSNLIGYLNAEIREQIRMIDPVEDFVSSLPQEFNRYGVFARAQWLESYIFMSGYLLSSQGDRMAMANSVEGRYPFLDHRVIEFAAKLHPDLKLNGLNEKFLLKKVMSGKIPQSVINRSKQAYRAPISGSFLGNRAPDYLQEMLSADGIKKYDLFDSNKVTELLKRMQGMQGSEIENMALAAILSTQLLYKQFIEEKPALSTDMRDCKVIRGD
jgi:asparagine synthase (glutamine-hydrolysing)